jgi:REP element-mobilizing transposase RayT
MPFALHVTWTTYGSRLPGDARGYVSNTIKPKGGFEPKENVRGTPVRAGDAYTSTHASTLQKFPAVLLSREQARWVAEELVGVGMKEGWRIPRAAVMENHVHVLVTDCPQDGPLVRRKLKGVVQAGLSKRLGKPMKWWTDDGSNRYKHDEAAIAAADNYIANQSGMLAGVVDNRAFVVNEEGEVEFVE